MDNKNLRPEPDLFLPIYKLATYHLSIKKVVFDKPFALAFLVSLELQLVHLVPGRTIGLVKFGNENSIMAIM